MKCCGSVKEVATQTRTSRDLAAWARDDFRIHVLHEQQIADPEPEKIPTSRKPVRSSTGLKMA